MFFESQAEAVVQSLRAALHGALPGHTDTGDLDRSLDELRRLLAMMGQELHALRNWTAHAARPTSREVPNDGVQRQPSDGP